jgi:excisionase family DNA binding protein
MVSRMSYTIEAAATATGLNKKTLLRAIKSGKLTGTKDERGEWLIEPAELHHVFPAVADRSADGGAAPRYAEADVEALGAQIEALLRQAGARLRQQLDDVRRHRDDAMAFSGEAEAGSS